MYKVFRDLFNDNNKGTYMILKTDSNEELIISPYTFHNGNNGFRFKLYTGDLRGADMDFTFSASDCTHFMMPEDPPLAEGNVMNHQITKLRSNSFYKFYNLYYDSYNLLYHLFNSKVFQSHGDINILFKKRAIVKNKLKQIDAKIARIGGVEND